jgi:hypothetical protein
MSTDTLQTFAIMGLTIALIVVIHQLRKTMRRARKLKATVIRHNQLLIGDSMVAEKEIERYIRLFQRPLS